MAEHLLRQRVGEKAGWTIESAGVVAVDGLPASAPAVEALAELGLDLTEHRSRALTAARVNAATVIVVMTEAHRMAVVGRFPDAADRVHLIRAFDQSNSQRDVPDPIGASIETYRQVRDDIAKALPDLQIFLHQERAAPAPLSERGER